MRYAWPKFYRNNGRLAYYNEFHGAMLNRNRGWSAAHCGKRGAKPFVSVKERIQRRNEYPNPTDNFMFEYAKRFYGMSQFSYMPLVGLDPQYRDRDCYLGKKFPERA